MRYSPAAMWVSVYIFQTYFYQEENLLSGLSLSKENLTIRPEYEEVLVFYGFDLQPINVIFHQPTTGTPAPEKEEATTEMEMMTTTEEEMTTMPSTSSSTTTPSTTTEAISTTTEEETTTLSSSSSTSTTTST